MVVVPAATPAAADEERRAFRGAPDLWMTSRRDWERVGELRETALSDAAREEKGAREGEDAEGYLVVIPVVCLRVR